MDNICIVSDNVYVKLSLSTLISQLCEVDSLTEKLYIYTFENNYLNEEQFLHLLNCDAERVLVLSPPSLLMFLSTLNLSSNITLGNYDASLRKIINTLSSFVCLKKTTSFRKGWGGTVKNKIGRNELRVMLMYIQGMPVRKIAFLLNISYKTVYSHKRNAMLKLGIMNDSELMQRKNWIMLANKSNIIYIN